ncbi:C-type lectin BfL-1-like [Pungitius pungitius]
MRPAGITACLLVVLMPMSATTQLTPEEMCSTKYKVPCTKDMGKGWYQMGPNRCVKAFFHNAHLSFDDAERTCQKLPGGHLVSIRSPIELSIVQCAMYRETTGKAHYWIGLKKQMHKVALPFVLLTSQSDYQFVWTDGSGPLLGFSHWAKKQPDNFLWREHCVEMNYWSWGLWNDEQCYLARPYVCSIKV